MFTNSVQGSASSQEKQRTAFKNPLLYSSMAIAVALLAVGWVFFSRWQENRDIEKKATDERAEKRRQDDRTALEQLGGKDLAIQMFYASPPAIQRGESAQICYGVANAKTVKLEPEAGPVWPSYSRCIDASPTKTTTYMLTIQDASGNTKTESIEIKVR